MSSAQSGLIPQGTGNQILTPLAKKQAQVYRDNAVSGDGTYYGRLPDGTNEKIGGPGAGSGIPFGNDTNAAANVIQVTLPGFVSLVDDYTFEVRNLTTNTGATQLQIGASGLKDVVDTDGNPLAAGMLVDGSIYLFAYDATKDKYELLGLAKAQVPFAIPFGNDTNVGNPEVITVTPLGFTALSDGYTFEVRKLGTNVNNGPQIDINGEGVRDVKDTKGNPVFAGNLVGGVIYLFTYDQTNDRFILLSPSQPYSFSLSAEPTTNPGDENERARFILHPSIGAEVDYTYTYVGFSPTVIRPTFPLLVTDGSNGAGYPALNQLTVGVFATNKVSVLNTDTVNARLFTLQFRATHIATGATADCSVMVGLPAAGAP